LLGIRRGTVLSERVRETQGESRSPLLWLNVVCLDAPVVAVCWQELFTRSLLATVTLQQRAALFLTAWLIYLLDRQGDSITSPADAPASARQKFAQRHRTAFLVTTVFVTAANAFVIPQLDRRTLISGGVLGAACGVYLLINHFFSRIWRTIPVKELTIGSLFAGGVRASFGADGLPRFGPVATLFAALCALNCISIALWERDIDRAQRRNSIATAFPFLSPLPLAGCAGLAAISIGCIAFSKFHQLLLCIAASSALLAWLNLPHIPVERDTRTALADLVLLTPLVFICSGGL
jgi:hypothetical protein